MPCIPMYSTSPSLSGIMHLYIPQSCHKVFIEMTCLKSSDSLSVHCLCVQTLQTVFGNAVVGRLDSSSENLIYTLTKAYNVSLSGVSTSMVQCAHSSMLWTV